MNGADLWSSQLKMATCQCFDGHVIRNTKSQYLCRVTLRCSYFLCHGSRGGRTLSFLYARAAAAAAATTATYLHDFRRGLQSDMYNWLGTSGKLSIVHMQQNYRWRRVSGRCHKANYLWRTDQAANSSFSRHYNARALRNIRVVEIRPYCAHTKIDRCTERGLLQSKPETSKKGSRLRARR
jgi:hypothetical protein